MKENVYKGVCSWLDNEGLISKEERTSERGHVNYFDIPESVGVRSAI